MSIGNNLRPSQVAMTTSFAAVLGRNNNRKALILFNSGANPVRVSFVGAANNDTIYVEIPAGQGLNLFQEACPQNAVRAASSTSTSTLNVFEG